MYGNYCGPYWSDGKFQSSVVGTREPIDELDETCMRHDAAYATNQNLETADFKFFNENFGRGTRRSIYGGLVGLQGLIRRGVRLAPNIFYPQVNMSQNPTVKRALPSAKMKTTKAIPRTPAKTQGMSVVPVAASYGTVIRSVKPVIKRTTNGATFVGRDFLGTVEGAGTSTFGLGKSALLSPAYIQSAMLGNLSRSFEKYRFNRLRVHYVPKVGTNAVGQLVMCSQHSVSEPGLQPESASFLNRAMTQGNAVLSPLWMDCFIDIDCSDGFKLVDPATTSDPDDAIHEELQVYTQVSVSAQVGYLWMEYDITFKDPIYQPHSTLMPIYTGPGARVTFTDTAAVNPNPNMIKWSEATSVLNFTLDPSGTVYRFVIDLTASAPAGSTTFANLMQSSVFYHTSTSAITVAATSVPIIGGTTFYILRLSSLDYAVYSSLEAAIAGDGSGQMIYRTSTTTAGAYAGDLTLIRYGPSINLQIQ